LATIDQEWPLQRHWPDIAWVLFAALNLAGMIVFASWETVPFHFIWVSLTILYGFRVWSNGRTAAALAFVIVATGVVLTIDIARGQQPLDELTEVPLMSAMFLAMVWHARRRLAVIDELEKVSEANLQLLDRERRFVQDASHELRTPITVALGQVELISRTTEDPQLREDAGIAVEELMRRRDAAEELQASLAEVGDLERRFARVAVGSAGPRDVAALAAGLKVVPRILEAASRLAAARFRALCELIPETDDVVARVEATLAPAPPVLASAGGVIRDGADAELDALRDLRRNAQTALMGVEASERKRSGISGVKVRFNRVFGYSLEVSNAHKDKVPADWIRRQSLANAERFVTPALKELEEKILGAEDRIAVGTRLDGTCPDLVRQLPRDVLHVLAAVSLLGERLIPAPCRQ